MGIYTEMIKQRVFPTFLRVFFDGRLYLLSSSGSAGYSHFPVIFGQFLALSSSDLTRRSREDKSIYYKDFCAQWIPASAGMTTYRCFQHFGLCATLTRSLRSGPPIGVAFGPRFCGTAQIKSCRWQVFVLRHSPY